MSQAAKALLLGATGGCGSQALARLLEREVQTTVIVRDKARLPAGLRDHALLKVIVEPKRFLALSAPAMRDLVQRCGTVVSCVGHNPTLSGLFGEPRRLCLDTVRSVCEAARELDAPEPVKVIVLSTGLADRPDGADPRRGWLERSLLWVLEALLPPHRDNLETVRYLHTEVAGEWNPHVSFCAVRPSYLVDGAAGEYTLHATLQDGIFKGRQSTRANVGRFMADLAAEPALMDEWRDGYPQILDVEPAPGPAEKKGS